jgi:superfamily II DNA or RNA helicase
MAPRTKVTLTLQRDAVGKPISGVGPGVGREFTKSYFPEAQHVVRIASAYFTLTGYKQGRKHISSNVQFQVLVGREEGQNVKATVIDEILRDLGQCSTDLWSTVYDLVERMKAGLFIIRDAREMETPFHCKFYICDAQIMWHGSANYTGSGLNKNAEQVSVSRDEEQITQFTRWYDEVSLGARDLMSELIAKLEAWLNLAKPFDIYLKTLLLLNSLPDYTSRDGADLPVYYQKGVIARGIRQANAFGGALIVVATGLGKTVIGSEIVWRLQLEHKVKRIILIAPNTVRENWEQQLESRDVYAKFFNIDVLFRQTSTKSHHQVTKIDALLRQADHETAIIIDEAHYYRNQLLSEKSKGRKSLVYQRLLPTVNQGAKIFLLTATAYGTNFQNLNSLLHLLPHRRPNLIDEANAWTANSADEFATLPVVTTLGLPHVLKMARDRGDVDSEGRTYVQFTNERRYLPKTLKLHSVRYDLFLQAELQEAFDHHYFDQAAKFPQPWFNDETMSLQNSIIDIVYNSSLLSWLSSPIAMADSIEQNIATPSKHESSNTSNNVEMHSNIDMHVQQLDLWNTLSEDQDQHNDYNDAPQAADRRYETLMLVRLIDRQRILGPILSQIKFGVEDGKLLKLLEVVKERYINNKSKIIIFVCRHLTALYLASKLEENFNKQIRVGSTVELVEINPRLKAGPYRSEVLKRFSPRSHNFNADQEYDVLICTDADGVGVNLQDADTIINYDPPDGADVLFQRAGRVLRMTSDSQRVVHFYTLVPSSVDDIKNSSRASNDIREIFNRVTNRHYKSKRILGSDVLSAEISTEISLDINLDVEQLTRDSNFLDDIGGLESTSVASHAAILEKHQEHAKQLPDYLLSARTYKQQKHRLFVLLQHEAIYHPVLFNLSTKRFEAKSELDILDIIACSESEAQAMVNPAYVERIVNRTAQIWCEHKDIPIDQVNKICALYLVPVQEEETIATILRDLRTDEDEVEDTE